MFVHQWAAKVSSKLGIRFVHIFRKIIFRHSKAKTNVKCLTLTSFCRASAKPTNMCFITMELLDSDTVNPRLLKFLVFWSQISDLKAFFQPKGYLGKCSGWFVHCHYDPIVQFRQNCLLCQTVGDTETFALTIYLFLCLLKQEWRARQSKPVAWAQSVSHCKKRHLAGWPAKSSRRNGRGNKRVDFGIRTYCSCSVT